MRMHFFEEFPSDENLGKARWITWKAVLYVAAKSVSEFRIYERKLKKINPKLEIGYWPILEKSYWISPFSYTSELNSLIEDLKGFRRMKVLIDLELPFLRKRLFLRNFPFFFLNKHKIKKIFRSSLDWKIDILTAEYHAKNYFEERIFELLGISYSLERYDHHRLIMMYSSMISSKRIKRAKNFVNMASQKHGDKLFVGVGTIAKGILGDEPILSPENLKRDLKFLYRVGVENVIVFRLGGLNKEYLKVIHEFV